MCNACVVSTSLQLTLIYYVIINLLVREYNSYFFVVLEKQRDTVDCILETCYLGANCN
jgi:hypothetical protein